MFVPFNEMKDSSRLWVYQCSRTLTNDEAGYVAASLEAFLSEWKAHGQPLLCSFLLQQNMFLVLAVDEDAYGASGCSIDASVHALQTIQQKIGVDFFGRDFVVFNVGGELLKARLQELKEMAAKGEIAPETPVYNTLVDRKSKLGSEWLVPAGSTWLKRYFRAVNTFQ